MLLRESQKRSGKKQISFKKGKKLTQLSDVTTEMRLKGCLGLTALCLQLTKSPSQTFPCRRNLLSCYCFKLYTSLGEQHTKWRACAVPDSLAEGETSCAASDRPAAARA